MTTKISELRKLLKNRYVGIPQMVDEIKKIDSRAGNLDRKDAESVFSTRSDLIDKLLQEARVSGFTILERVDFICEKRMSEIMDKIEFVGGFCVPRSFGGFTYKVLDGMYVLIPSEAIYRILQVETLFGGSNANISLKKMVIRLKTQDCIIYTESWGHSSEIDVTPKSVNGLTGYRMAELQEMQQKINDHKKSGVDSESILSAIKSELLQLLPIIMEARKGVIFRDLPERDPIFVMEIHDQGKYMGIVTSVDKTHVSLASFDQERMRVYEDYDLPRLAKEILESPGEIGIEVLGETEQTVNIW
ncbi:MAG: hypothetical protein WC788_07455 [Candidatus Paceibacterota bacterium]|jgi:hypothetical protein